MMQIHISSDDGVPIYLQIVNQVKYLVASGRLAPGEELPPIRVLAEKLVVNPNTVARAYRELETAGVVTKRRTTGTYVDRKSTRLNSSHGSISYAVFCLKKKKTSCNERIFRNARKCKFVLPR